MIWSFLADLAQLGVLGTSLHRTRRYVVVVGTSRSTHGLVLGTHSCFLTITCLCAPPYAWPYSLGRKHGVDDCELVPQIYYDTGTVNSHFEKRRSRQRRIWPNIRQSEIHDSVREDRKHCTVYYTTVIDTNVTAKYNMLVYTTVLVVFTLLLYTTVTVLSTTLHCALQYCTILSEYMLFLE